jgi:hypothetical protein
MSDMGDLSDLVAAAASSNTRRFKRPTKKSNPLLVAVVAVAVIIAATLLIAVAGNLGNSSPPTVQATSEQVLSDYSSNEVRADQLYKGAKVLVSGTIDSIGKDVLDHSYVTLKGSGFRRIQCFAADDSELVSLHPGQQISIVGMGDGMFGNVIFKKCHIENN